MLRGTRTRTKNGKSRLIAAAIALVFVLTTIMAGYVSAEETDPLTQNPPEQQMETLLQPELQTEAETESQPELQTEAATEPQPEQQPEPISDDLNTVQVTEEVIQPWIASDLPDYFPGSVVTLTGGGWTGDDQVSILVEDSVTDSWSEEITALVAEDGTLEVQFYIPYWYVPEYSVTATGLTTGMVALTTFTDQPGAYSIDFSAYDPDFYTSHYPEDFPKLTPSERLFPTGRALNPIPGADSLETDESLAPDQLALGQIVPYEARIEVLGNTAPENGVMTFTVSWNVFTTNGGNFGFDPTYGLYAAFVDAGHGLIDPDGDAKVTADGIYWEITGTGTNQQIMGTITVEGLDSGDTIVVEMWVVLKETIAASVGGNVQTALEEAYTGPRLDPIATINTGNQTVPLLKVGSFYSAITEVGITKSDSPDPLYQGDTLTYSIRVTNNSLSVVANMIVIKDYLDPNVTFVSASDGGVYDSITHTVTWPAFALDPGFYRDFTVTVTVDETAPTEAFPGTDPDTRGAATAVRFTGADISNVVSFTMITQDSNMNNNVYQVPTNVLPKFSVTATKIWVGGPTADHEPVVLTLYRHIAGDLPEEYEVVTGFPPVIVPASGPADTFTYTWSGLPMYDAQFNLYIYTVEELTVPANYTLSVDRETNTFTNTYKPSLAVAKYWKEMLLDGAVFELYKDANEDGILDVLVDTLVATKTTGAAPDLTGIATFAHLEDGTYWVMETQPPTGYYAVFKGAIGPFTVAGGVITAPEASLHQLMPDEGNLIFTVEVQNEPMRELPAAGGTGTLPYAVGGLALMILASYRILARRRAEAGE